jgi:hypothetical protein
MHREHGSMIGFVGLVVSLLLLMMALTYGGGSGYC